MRSLAFTYHELGNILVREAQAQGRLPAAPGAHFAIDIGYATAQETGELDINHIVLHVSDDPEELKARIPLQNCPTGRGE